MNLRVHLTVKCVRVHPFFLSVGTLHIILRPEIKILHVEYNIVLYND